MFSVGFGSEKREAKIREMGREDLTTAVILAAVHFEWMLKRAILKLGRSPTKKLREQLERVYSISDRDNRDGYKSIWAREIQPRYKRAALGTVLGKLTAINDNAMAVRGRVIHGNGTVSKTDAHKAIELFLTSGKKLRDFTLKNGDNLDSRLKARIKELSG